MASRRDDDRTPLDFAVFEAFRDGVDLVEVVALGPEFDVAALDEGDGFPQFGVAAGAATLGGWLAPARTLDLDDNLVRPRHRRTLDLVEGERLAHLVRVPVSRAACTRELPDAVVSSNKTPGGTDRKLVSAQTP